MEKVMIVDDEIGIRVSLEVVLEYAGMDVTLCKSGQECLEALQNGFKGVILLDVMMPEMDGWQTIRAIRKNDLINGNAIVMLTALDDPGDAAVDLKELVIDYLRKPFDPDELVERVKEYSSCID